MDKTKFITVIIACISFGCFALTGNKIVTSDVWSNVNIYKRNVDRQVLHDFDNKLDNKENRYIVIQFIDNKLVNSKKISHKDQIRLGGIFRILKRKVKPDEYNMMSSLISLGKNYYDYYALALSLEPQYLLESIEIFKIKEPVIARFANPDGGTAQYDLKKHFLYRLKKSTKNDFGYDYEKWKNWWVKNGKYMKYNPKTRVYY